METPVTPEEDRIFLALGYLVVRWNYAEHHVRQLLRRASGAGSMLELPSIKVSNSVSSVLAVDLSALAKKWEGREGEPYIKCLEEAFKVAIDHRNHLVHGTWMTVACGDPETAMAVMIPSKIRNSQHELPSHVPVEEFEGTAHYFHDLGMFARSVHVGFAADGERAFDGERQPVIPHLPPMIELLPPIERIYLNDEQTPPEEMGND
jgi:hypothetical protein